MKSDLARGLAVCVAGMQASLIFILLVPTLLASLDPVGKSGYGDFPAADQTISLAVLVSSVAGFVIMMVVQKRFRTDRMAPWVLAALFVLGMAICAAVGWGAYPWAHEIAAFLSII